MKDEKVVLPLKPDEIVFLRDAARFAEASDLRSTLSREERKQLAGKLQDLYIRFTSHVMYSTFALELHLVDEAAFKKTMSEARKYPDNTHVATCVFCQHPVKQCTCDQWVVHRQ